MRDRSSYPIACISPVLSTNAIFSMSSSSASSQQHQHNGLGGPSPVAHLINGSQKLSLSHRANLDSPDPSLQHYGISTGGSSATNNNGNNNAGSTQTSTAHPAISPLQQQQHTTTESFGIKEVFAYNLEEEMRKLNRLVKKFPFIAIDTEFPGIVARPCGVFSTNSDYEYALFKVNVDLMKIIQLGLSFFDEKGQQPSPIHTWQFNFRFNLAEEMYAQDSIKLLMHSGIQFSLHESIGIEPDHFAERLITSNIVCNDQVRFVTFHSAYDFGYLLKVLEGIDSLPKSEVAFLEKLKMFFPHIFDIKFMIRDQRNLKGGLQDLANQFQLVRVGAQHQAGSDSALTGTLFFRLRDDIFHGKLDEFIGRLFGLTGSFGDRVHLLENVKILENTKTSSSNSSHSSATTTSTTAATVNTNTNTTPPDDSSGGDDSKNRGQTFTVLTNVNIPNRFYEDAAGYIVTQTSSTGEFVVSNDPSIIQQQQQQHAYSNSGTSYYESNGYV